MQEIITQGLLTTGGVSGLGGFAVGYFGKKLLKVAAFIAGGIICLFGGLELSKVGTINWAILQADVTKAMTIASLYGHQLIHQLAGDFGAATHTGMAVGGGFIAGLVIGWRIA